MLFGLIKFIMVLKMLGGKRIANKAFLASVSENQLGQTSQTHTANKKNVDVYRWNDGVIESRL